MKLLIGGLLMWSSFANASIENLPKELKRNEAYLEQSTTEAVGSYFNCDLTNDELDTLLTDFILTNGKQQPKEYAEYPGELKSFTINATATLPDGKCDKVGFFRCKMNFQIYDERAYELGRDSIRCN
jgi:hypothetical protein